MVIFCCCCFYSPMRMSSGQQTKGAEVSAQTLRLLLLKAWLVNPFTFKEIRGGASTKLALKTARLAPKTCDGGGPKIGEDKHQPSPPVTGVVNAVLAYIYR
jgi:hypothetical protein